MDYVPGFLLLPKFQIKSETSFFSFPSAAQDWSFA